MELIIWFRDWIRLLLLRVPVDGGGGIGDSGDGFDGVFNGVFFFDDDGRITDRSSDDGLDLFTILGVLVLTRHKKELKLDKIKNYHHL